MLATQNEPSRQAVGAVSLAARWLIFAIVGMGLLVTLPVATSLRIFDQLVTSNAGRDRTGNLIDRAGELWSELKDAETSQRSYMLLGDQQLLEPYLALQDGIRGHLRELRQQTKDSAATTH